VLHPDDTNVPNHRGRTPLVWAAAKGDARAVVALLSHDADPNIIDIQIYGPVSNAAAQRHTACVRLLLEAGAYPQRLRKAVRSTLLPDDQMISYSPKAFLNLGLMLNQAE
jgi:ankyrin repeat protein